MFYIQHSEMIETCKSAAQKVISDDENWLEILNRTRDYYLVGNKFKRAGNDLEWGDKPDIPDLFDSLKQIEIGADVSIIKSALDIEPQKIKFKPIGWPAWDNHIGGTPVSGMTVIQGIPGSAKSTLALQQAKYYVKNHLDEVVAVLSQEMTDGECRQRLNEISPDITDEQLSRIKIIDAVIPAEKIINLLATIDNLGMAWIDFAEITCAASGPVDEKTMSYTFSTIAVGCKTLRIPISFLCQPNRGFTGGIPLPHSVYMSGAAHKLAHLFVSVYNPHYAKTFDDPDAEKLMLRKGQAALAVWKARGGVTAHPTEFPGAVILGYDGKLGFSPNSERPDWMRI